ncbi:MAG: hypothetical protein ACOYNY_02835 [Caldilineaceae bacterium]|jgi:hypothetical protein
MSSKVFTQAVAELAVLPEDALLQVLLYIETLKQTYVPDPEIQSALPAARYPLRGESYTYHDPFEPAVPAEAWDAMGADHDSD